MIYYVITITGLFFILILNGVHSLVKPDIKPPKPASIACGVIMMLLLLLWGMWLIANYSECI